MIYSTIERIIPSYGLIPDCSKFSVVDSNPVFIYDELDSSAHGIELDTAFNPVAWSELKTNPNSRLLINFTGDFLNLHDINKFKRAFESTRVPIDRVWLLVMDSNVVGFVKQHLPDIRCTSYNYLLNNVTPQTIANPDTNYRFSVLSRNYRPWRLKLLVGLLKLGVLDRTLYSFHDINPYSSKKPVYSAQEIVEDLQSMGYKAVDQEIQRWLAGVPYDLPNSNCYNKHSNATVDTIRRAGVHLLIESHWDPFCYWSNYQHMDPREFSPGFPTEKTYKAIACSRPFIAVTTPYFLESLKNLGFKTFSPYINESYDQEPDNNKRMNMILLEVNRIANMSPEEYQTFIGNVATVCLDNYYRFKELKAQDTLVDEWAWLKEYLK